MAVERHPPPMVKGRRVRPKYIAQTKARPPTFVLIATRASALPDSYRRYLVNSIRQSFDLPGTPVRLTVKANKNPYADESDGARTPYKPKRAPKPRQVAQKAGPKSKSSAAAGPPSFKSKRPPAARPSTRKTAPKPSAGRGPPRPRAPRS
jgi:GTP-binding protein